MDTLLVTRLAEDGDIWTRFSHNCCYLLQRVL